MKWERPRLVSLTVAPRSRPRKRNEETEKQMRRKKIDNAKTLSRPAVGRGLIVVVGVGLVTLGGRRQREGEFVGLMPTMGQGRWWV